jgi:hypothetical protein
MVKGTGSRKRIFKIFFTKIYTVVLDVNKTAYQFLNYLNATLVSFCLHHFHHG